MPETPRRSLLLLLAFLFCFPFAIAHADDKTNRLDLPPDFFAILSWDLPEWAENQFPDPHHGITSLAQCSFNTCAFVRPADVPQVEKAHMRCIVAHKEFPVPWRTMSDQQIEAKVKQLIDETGNSKAVIGFFLADEPGAPDFPALAKAVAAVKKFAPGKLAYINLFPDYATLGAPNISQLGTATYTDYLEQYVAQVHPQFISYDNYRIPYSFDQKDPGTAASYYYNLLAVRQVAQKYGLPFWNIVSSCQLLPNIPPPSPAELSMQAYTTLAAGAKGLTWYTYFDPGYLYCPIDKAGHRTPTWATLRMLNEQIKTLAKIISPTTSTGVYFTNPPASGLPKLPGKLIAQATSDVPIMIGEFQGKTGEQFALIVNCSLAQSTKVTLQLQQGLHEAQVISATDASAGPLDPGQSLWLTPGQGALLKVK